MIELLDQPPLAALSDSRTLFEVGLIIVLAAAAPLIAQVLRVPSILLMMALGFGAGAIGALDPNALLGEAVLSAVVSIAGRVHPVLARLVVRSAEARAATHATTGF